MSLVLAAALVASTAALPNCSWDRPGVNPFMGNVVAAVDRYADIPAPVRMALKKRMAARQYDEIASIKRGSIDGKYNYTDLRDMHFGAGQVCQTVTREKWSDNTVERGLVYCESGHCLIVPTVCRNVSRVTRGAINAAEAEAPAGRAGGGAGGAGGGGGGDGGSQTAAASPGELDFDAPSAGAAPASFAGRSADAAPGWVGGGSLGTDGPRSGSGSGHAGPLAGSVFAGASFVGGGGGGGGSGGLPPQREMPGVSFGPKPAAPAPGNEPPDGPPDRFGPPPPSLQTTPVPEASTWALLASGLLMLAAATRHRRRQRRRPLLNRA
jgi:hypothetical protein